MPGKVTHNEHAYLYSSCRNEDMKLKIIGILEGVEERQLLSGKNSDFVLSLSNK